MPMNVPSLLTVPLSAMAISLSRAQRISSVTPLSKRRLPVSGYFRGSLALLLHALPTLPVWPLLSKLSVTGQLRSLSTGSQLASFVSSSVQSPLTSAGVRRSGAVVLSAQAVATSSIVRVPSSQELRAATRRRMGAIRRESTCGQLRASGEST
jgi:hypothetical protein